MKWKRITARMVKDMQRLRQEGLTCPEIAEHFNVATSSVQRHLNSHSNDLHRRRQVARYYRIKADPERWAAYLAYMRDYRRRQA
jgi:IS30 family transposase